MHTLITIVTKAGLLTADLDDHGVRAALVILLLLFGYQKWFAYEAQVLIPSISHGPLLAWRYPVFGIRGAVGFWGRRNRGLARSCAQDSGIKNAASLEPSVPGRPSSGPSLLFPLCPMAGRCRPAGFPPWLATCRS
jgi:Protein of unknown function, DUF417